MNREEYFKIKPYSKTSKNAPMRYINLFNIIEDIKPTTIVEIGVWNAENACAMIRHARKFQPFVKYYGFDLFEQMTEEKFRQEYSKMPLSVKECYNRLKQIHGCKAELFAGDTKVTLPQFKPLYAIDFIFIDGGHSEATIRSDWLACSQLMHPKTVCVFDDYIRHGKYSGCNPIIQDLLDDRRYDVAFLGPVDDLQNPHFGKLAICMAKVTLSHPV